MTCALDWTQTLFDGAAGAFLGAIVSVVIALVVVKKTRQNDMVVVREQLRLDKENQGALAREQAALVAAERLTSAINDGVRGVMKTVSGSLSAEEQVTVVEEASWGMKHAFSVHGPALPRDLRASVAKASRAVDDFYSLRLHIYTLAKQGGDIERPVNAYMHVLLRYLAVITSGLVLFRQGEPRPEVPDPPAFSLSMDTDQSFEPPIEDR